MFHRAAVGMTPISFGRGPRPGYSETVGGEDVDPAPDGRLARREKAAPKSRLQIARMLLGLLLGGLGRLALAGFIRCRVVDLADVVGLDRERLVLNAVRRVRLGLDLAFNDDRRPGLERGRRSPSIGTSTSSSRRVNCTRSMRS